MKTRDFIILDETSTDEFENLMVNLPPVPPLAERRHTSYDIGTDEDSVLPDEAFNDIKYTIEFSMIDVQAYDNSRLYKLIAEAKTLQISRLPGYFYKIRKASMGQPTSQYNGDKVRYRINFVLSPFKYHMGEPPVEITTEGVITNSGTRYSKPIIEFTQTETTTIDVNGAVFEIMATSERTVVVDSERKIVYDKNTKELLYNMTKGEYPMLAVGDNVIATNAGSLLITKNERSY